MPVSKKEIKKKLLIKQTINAMNKQIQKLEEQKQVYIDAGKRAKHKGLKAQYDAAVTGLRMTLTQQKKVEEMKLNFEITSQMKDMTVMTSEFLKGMGTLSRDMMKLTKEKDFRKVQQQFTAAMTGVEMQTQNIESFMEDTQSAFATSYSGSAEDNKEIENIISVEAGMEHSTDEMIEKELKLLEKRMGE